MKSIVKEIGFARAKDAVAAGQTDVDSDIIDLGAHGGCKGIAFLLALGTISATGTVIASIFVGDEVGGGDMTEVTATQVSFDDGDSNKLAICELGSTSKRYAKLHLERGTANSVVDGIFAMLREPTYRPVTQPATVQGTAFAAAA